ncbi:hypothetical protein Tco_0668040 [Tanacetum coccineum]
MTHYHNCLIRQKDGHQDPPQGPLYPLPDRSQQCSLVPHPQLALSLKDAQAPEGKLVHGPQVHTLENVVPAPATVGQPPRKDPQMEYSKIVPQSEQTYR